MTSQQKAAAHKPWRVGEPCDHKGCLSHISHPCEGCGRIAGRRQLVIDKTKARALATGALARAGEVRILELARRVITPEFEKEFVAGGGTRFDYYIMKDLAEVLLAFYTRSDVPELAETVLAALDRIEELEKTVGGVK